METTTEAAAPPGEVLNPEALLAAASQETGLDDFGPGPFHESLTRYLESMLAETALSPMGVMVQQAYFHRLLVNRLRFEADLTRHPEILDEQIVAPIVIVSLPRTGTSKLHRMMSRLPNAQRLTFWRILNPAPFPDAPPDGPDPRIAQAKEFEGLLTEHFPDLLAAHPWQTEEPDEECLLQELTVQGVSICTRARVPSFTSWMLEQNLDESYAYLHRLLRYLQWQEEQNERSLRSENPNGGRGRPWILKSPSHLGRLTNIVRTFPDATLLHTHRDLDVVLPSAARLIEVLRRMATDEIDLHDLGDEMLRVWSGEAARNVAQRAELGDAVPIMDIQYADIRQDPIGVIREVFERRDEPLTAEDETQMLRWETEFPQFRFGSHVYSQQRYGMTPERIKDAFAVYLDRFEIAPDPR